MNSCSISDILSQFESLGDNCEFGFVQRKYGLEPGGLLRWAIASPTALIAALAGRFSEMYSYDALRPSSDDMVLDTKYGLFLHTKLRSEECDGIRRYKLSLSEQREIHADELTKVKHLSSKLLKQLEAAEKIFVYKRNIGVTSDEEFLLRDSILSYNPLNTLLLVGTYDKAPGSVWRAGAGLLKASIDRFAPYSKADDVSYNVWLEICREASRQHERGKHFRQD